MKNQAFVYEEYPKACRYCEYGSLSFDEQAVLCPKKGIKELDDVCRRYVYDPLKRKPMKKPALKQVFTAADFEL
jgi:hypothetical protein